MVKKEVEVNFKMDKQDLLVTRQIETSISMDKGVSLKKKTVVLYHLGNGNKC